MTVSKDYDNPEPEREPESWVPVHWCQDYWHSDHAMPDRPCPTCGQTDRMDATTSDWLKPADEVADETVIAPPAEAVHYTPKWNGDLTACGIGVGHVTHLSFAVEVATCPACLDVVDRANSPLAPIAAWDGPDLSDVAASYEQDYRDHLASQAAPEHTDWAGMSDDELEGRLRGSLKAAAEFPELAPPPIGPVEPPAEQRTVGLEVLTDELRAAHDLFGGVVGIVMRVDGRSIDVPEIDTLWAAAYRKPADILSILLRQARMYADGLDGDSGGELLMPGADVLAALAGQPVGAYTAPIKLRADQVDVGWLARDLTTVGAWDRIEAVVECEDVTCTWSDCHVVIAEGTGPVHFAGYQTLIVRIPAGER